MNMPTPKEADNCRDYHFEEEDHTEIFTRANDPALFNCTIKNTYFVHARSQKPTKEETIAVISNDQGGYGFLRSFANINQGGRDSIKGELPVYEPVPIPALKVPHPEGRPKKNIYKDNRVSVPRDVDENRIADGGYRTRGNEKIKDAANPRADDDNQLAGDGYPGDGISNYEEYRGFLVNGFFIRTNNKHKDLFINNEDGFNLGTFKAALSEGAGANVKGVDVHEIRRFEYVDNQTREINFNYNPQLHFVRPFFEPIRVQKGLWIFARNQNLVRPGLLGHTIPTSTIFNNVNTPPNWVAAIIIYTESIRKFALRVGLNADVEMMHVATHELGHGISMYHHGERIFVSQGLQSGNINCIMRYDNIPPFNTGEAVGVIFCNSPKGTGNNALKDCKPFTCYGDAARGRGDCIHQFRISCRTIFFPRR